MNMAFIFQDCRRADFKYNVKLLLITNQPIIWQHEENEVCQTWTITITGPKCCIELNLIFVKMLCEQV